jgi:CRISPR-associated protein Csx14
MSRATLPVDLFNPGQVFACLGCLEVADVLLGDACGGFDWTDETKAVFHLGACGDADPMSEVLAFLAEAEVRAITPARELTAEGWSVPTDMCGGAAFPFAKPSSPATLPAVLRRGSTEIVIDHWGDTERDNVKFWAGAGGYPGAALLRDALALVRAALPSASKDPFAVCAPQTSSFRLDWRRDYVALGIGFSLNRHTKIEPLGFPVVEVLAAIGLTHARPERPERRNKLRYRYSALGGRDLPPSLLRAGLGCTRLPFPQRTFRIEMAWPGKEGQARCITDVIEET